MDQSVRYFQFKTRAIQPPPDNLPQTFDAEGKYSTIRPDSPSENSEPVSSPSVAGVCLIFCVVFAVTTIGRVGNGSSRSIWIQAFWLATRGQ